MDRIPDYNDLFDKYDAEQERQLERLPVCDCCEEPIQDEHYYAIGNEIFCKNCLDYEFRKNTEDYIERGWSS